MFWIVSLILLYIVLTFGMHSILKDLIDIDDDFVGILVVFVMWPMVLAIAGIREIVNRVFDHEM